MEALDHGPHLYSVASRVPLPRLLVVSLNLHTISCAFIRRRMARALVRLVAFGPPEREGVAALGLIRIPAAAF